MKLWFALLVVLGFSLFLPLPEAAALGEGRALEITVEDVVIFGDDAFVVWSTNKEAASVFSFGNLTAGFSSSTRFQILLENFDDETENFSIHSCTATECDEEQMPLAPYSGTPASESGESVLPVTGAVTGVAGAAGSHLATALFGAMILALAGGIGYSRLRQVDPVEDLIKRANEHASADDYDAAHGLYVAAREAFHQLENDKRVKNHPELLKLHNVLKRYSLIKEAQNLTEKYENGTITREEMKRLNDLMFF